MNYFNLKYLQKICFIKGEGNMFKFFTKKTNQQIVDKEWKNVKKRSPQYQKKKN